MASTVGDSFTKGSYEAFSPLLEISRNLTYSEYLFWPVLETLKSVSRGADQGRILIGKALRWLARIILLEFPQGAL